MSEILDRLREKYPAYNDISDEELIVGLGQKYPQYLDADPSFKDRFEKITKSTTPVVPAFRPSREIAPEPSVGPESIYTPERDQSLTEAMNFLNRTHPEFQQGPPMPQAESLAPALPTPPAPEPRIEVPSLGPQRPIPSTLESAMAGIGEPLAVPPGIEPRLEEMPPRTPLDVLSIPTKMPFPRLSQQDAERILPKRVAGVVAGTQQAIADFADFLTSPAGFATAIAPESMAGTALAKPVSKAIATGFAADMARNMPEQFQGISQALESGNTAEATRLALGAGAGALMIGGAVGAHLKGIRDYAIEKRTQQEGGQPEYLRTQAQRLPAEAGGGYRPVPSEARREAPNVPQVETPPPTPGQVIGTQRLTPQITDAEYLAAERQAIEEADKLGSPVQIVDTFTDEENAPFNNRFIARAFKHGIEINRAAFRQWLSETPPERRAEAVKSVMSEEHIHRHVNDADAKAYWDTLTGLEKAAETYQYTGFRSLDRANQELGVDLNPTDLGHEAVRRRLQKLYRSTPTEVAESALKERWTLKTVDALATMIRKARETMGTEAARRGEGIVMEAQRKLDLARSAIVAKQTADDNGWQLDTTPQVGAFQIPSDLSGYSPEDQAKLRALQAAQPRQWAFTDPKTGTTVYTREGATKEQIEATLKAKEKAPAALRRNVAAQTVRDLDEEYLGKWYSSANAEREEDAIQEALRDPQVRQMVVQRDLAKDPRTQHDDPATFLFNLNDPKVSARQAYPEIWEYISKKHPEMSEAFGMAQFSDVENQNRFARTKLIEAGIEPDEAEEMLANEDNWQGVAGDILHGNEKRIPDGLFNWITANNPFAWRPREQPPTGMAKVAETLKRNAQIEQQRLPGALRRRRPEDKTPPLPLLAGATREERATAAELGAEPVTLEKMKEAGVAHLNPEFQRVTDAYEKNPDAQIKPPSFDRYVDEMKRRFGDVKPGQLYETFSESLYNRLFTASGKTLEALQRSLGIKVKGKIADPTEAPGFALEGETQRQAAVDIEGERTKIRDATLRLDDMLRKYTETERQRPEVRSKMSRQQAIIDAAKEVIGARQEIIRQETQKVPQAERRALVRARNYRIGAIRLIHDKLTESAKDEAAARATRTEVTPDDVYGMGTTPRQKQTQQPVFWDIGAEYLKNPQVLGERLTADSRRFNRDPVSLTKRLTALLDSQSNKVYLVSTYPHGRTGAMLVDPGVSAIRAHKPLTQILQRYRPIASVLLDEPVRGFRQEFKSVGAFERDFATSARKASETVSEPPLTEGEAEVPGTRDVDVPMTDREAGAILDHIERESGKFDSPEDVKASLSVLGEDLARSQRLGRTEDTARTAISGYRKLFAALEKKYPTLSYEDLLDKLSKQLYENNLAGRTLKEGSYETFVGRTMAQAGARYRGDVEREAGLQPTDVPAGQELTLPIERRPPTDIRPENIPAEAAAQLRTKPAPPVPEGTLTPATSKPPAALRRRGKETEEFNSADLSVAARALWKEAISKPTELHGVDATHLTAEDRRDLARLGLSFSEDRNRRIIATYPQTLRAQDLRNAILAKQQPPAALRRRLPQSLQDDVEATGQFLRDLGAERGIKDWMARLADDMFNLPNIRARDVEMGIRLKSKPGKASALERITAFTGDKNVLGAAKALVSSGALRTVGTIDVAHAQNSLQIFHGLVDAGIADAKQMLATGSLFTRRAGRVKLRTAEQLKAELNYAESHLNDKSLINTAHRTRQELGNLFGAIKASGRPINFKDNYLPGRYDLSGTDGRVIIMQEPRIIGAKFQEPKVFNNYYEAIAERGKVYVPATLDVASLVGSAVRRGLSLIQKDKTEEILKGMQAPDGRPLAVDATSRGVPGATPTPPPGFSGYKVVGGLAIHPDFSPTWKLLTAPSYLEETAGLRHLLHFTQGIKHALLVGDLFHLGRITYYAASLMRGNFGFKGGWSALEFQDRDIGTAVSKGLISQAQADWGRTLIKFGNEQITRRELLRRSTSGGVGFNIGRIQDALYKDVYTQLTPTSGPIRRAFARITDPTTGRYNRFLFDKYTRGLMAEALVNEFERQSALLDKRGVEYNPKDLLKDISRDLNNYFGNIGRQGAFKSRTAQDLARLFFLAPQWVEGLVKKEAVGASRLTGASTLTGQRTGLTKLGATGTGMATGLAFMFGLAQTINFITRGKPTWSNEEENHKMDAWLPVGGENGMWFSPFSLFAEISHDLWRLSHTKPNFMNALDQVAGNKESPLTRAALIITQGFAPTGQKYMRSMEQLKAAGQALVPVPLTFGKLGQVALHKVIPSVVPPVPAQALTRQLFQATGIKLEPGETAYQRMSSLARNFMETNNYRKDTGWVQVMTEEPSYSKLRQQVRDGDEAAAKRTFEFLHQNRSTSDILKAMHNWSIHPLTGSREREKQFIQGLSDKELNTYTKAQEERFQSYNAFVDFLVRNNL